MYALEALDRIHEAVQYDKSIEKAKEPSTAESEEKSYEQQTLFPSTNMY